MRPDSSFAAAVTWVRVVPVVEDGIADLFGPSSSASLSVGLPPAGAMAIRRLPKNGVLRYCSSIRLISRRFSIVSFAGS